MANLSVPRERSQILLIAAFTLAVIFIALALVVNSAIFTENLASRGEISSGSEALTYKHQVERSVGEAIHFSNVYNHSGLLDDSLKNSISDVGFQGGNHSALGGQLVNVSYVSEVDGSRIADNVSGMSTFESNGGDADWQVADEVLETRRIVITTDETSLPGSESFAFELGANTTLTNEEWNVSIWEDPGGQVNVKVQTTGGAEATCVHDVSGVGQFDIDVTGGTVNGERCHALTRDGAAGTQMWFGTDIPLGASYNLTIENGDNIQGNYSMVVRPRGSWNDTHLNNGHDILNPAQPYRTDAIYSVTVNYVFRTQQVAYETLIEVAPGEPP